MTIGLDFHWQQQEDQQFHGTLRLKRDTQGHLIVLNEIAVEAYLTSVIASEMSATSPPALLKAHAIISRSWLLAQLPPWKVARVKASAQPYEVGGERHLIRWYDQESHTEFDVCADDFRHEIYIAFRLFRRLQIEAVVRVTRFQSALQ